MTEPYGMLAPRWLDRAVIAMTSRLPDNWLGLRLAILLRRLVTKRHSADHGLDVERWGLRMRLFPLQNGCEKGLLFTPQMYEARERAALAAEIDRPRAAGRPFVFVDIGANVGLFSLFVASRAGADADILAIEPEPENVRRLRFNIGANPGLPIRVIATALGESAGSVVLDVPPRDRGGTRTRRLPDEDQAADAPKVECRTLLQVLAQERVQSIDALKIDVEGAEAAILVPFFRDAPQLLWPRFLVIEGAGDLWHAAPFSTLKALGYRVTAQTRQNIMMRR